MRDDLRLKAEAILAQMGESPEKRSLSTLFEELSIHQIELELQNEELIRIQSELEESRSAYMFLYNQAPISYFTLDQKGYILELNRGGALLFANDAKKIQQKNFANFLHPDAKPIFAMHLQKLITSKEKQTCQIQLAPQLHPEHYLHLESVMTMEKTILLSASNITSLKKAKSELIKTNKSLQIINTLFQCATDAVSALDQHFNFIEFNTAFSHAFKKIFNMDVYCGMNLLNAISQHAALKRQLINLYERAYNSDTQACFEATVVNSATYGLHFHPLTEQQQMIGFSFIIKDITQYKLHERKLLKQQSELANIARMNAINEVTSAVLHELSQPLTSINAYVQGCLLKLYDDADTLNLRVPLKQIVAQSDRVTDVLQRMTHFMGKGMIYLEETDLNRLLKKAIDFVAYEIDDIGMKIVFDLDEAIPLLLIDKVQLTQVILNIVKNSIEAVNKQQDVIPKLTVQTRRQHDYVEVNFIDNGPGIKSELMDKILNSYFSTKALNTGLGLSISKKIIEAHGGKILVKPHTPGAWFQFTLMTN